MGGTHLQKLTLRKSSVSLAGWPFALQQPCFCMWKDHIYKRPGQFTNSIWRPYFDVAAKLQSDRSVILCSADWLFISTTKPEKRYFAKQLIKSFTQKVVLLFAFDYFI